MNMKLCFSHDVFLPNFSQSSASQREDIEPGDFPLSVDINNEAS